MASTPRWSRHAAAAAVLDVLSGPGAICAGALLLDAVPTAGGVLITFTWRRDPTVYGYLADDSGARTRSQRSGEPGSSEREWALDLRCWLMEQLETGGVRWARRLTRGQPVMLDLDEPRTERPRYFVDRVPTRPFPPGVHVIGGGPVPQLEPALAGRWLAEAGLHVGAARSSLLAGTLLCWVQAYTDEVRPSPVAHAVASWARERSAVLDTVEVLPGVVDGEALLTRLLWHVVYEATEQGAERLDLSAASEQAARAPGGPLVGGGSVLGLPPAAEIDPRHR